MYPESKSTSFQVRLRSSPYLMPVLSAVIRTGFRWLGLDSSSAFSSSRASILSLGGASLKNLTLLTGFDLHLSHEIATLNILLIIESSLFTVELDTTCFLSSLYFSIRIGLISVNL